MGRIDDGFSTRISFLLNPIVNDVDPNNNTPEIVFYEKEVTPPGIDGGGANDTTTMRNKIWRTQSPKKLKSLTPLSATVAYDPAVMVATSGAIDLLINKITQIKVTFPDGSNWTFYGWLNSFKPGQSKDGDQPTATIEVIPSNQDTNGAEVSPVYAAAA